MIRTSALLLLSLTTSAVAVAAEFKSDEARSALRDYEDALEELDAAYEATAKSLRDEYVTALKAAAAAAMSRDELDEVGRVVAAAEAIEQQPDSPPLARKGKPALLRQVAQLQSELQRLKSGTGTPKPQIPRDAAVFNGHRYFVQESGAPKCIAAQICRQMGGHLARIESADENAFVQSLIQSGQRHGYLIDGSDARVEGEWRFGDGGKMTWFNWTANQPDDAGQSEHALEIFKDGQWNDIRKGWRYGYVIEWDE